MLLHSYPRNGRINESRVHDQPIHEQPPNRKLSDIYPCCHSVSYHPPFVYFLSFNPSALTITAFRRKKRYLDRGKDGKTRKKGKKELLRLGQRDLIYLSVRPKLNMRSISYLQYHKFNGSCPSKRHHTPSPALLQANDLCSSL